jgi:hypothetical protein
MLADAICAPKGSLFIPENSEGFISGEIKNDSSPDVATVPGKCNRRGVQRLCRTADGREEKMAAQRNIKSFRIGEQ